MFVNRTMIWIAALSVAVSASIASAHCDAMDGPVVKDAQEALEQQNVSGVLKWVAAEDEAEVKRVFDQALRVRGQGDEARELADRYFFETLVRLHRASEGAAYTGLKPAGSPVPAPVTAVDAALEAGSIDNLIARLQSHVENEVRSRFDAAQAKIAGAGDDVEAGRKAVHAYVELVHYVKRLHDVIHSQGHGGHSTVHVHE